MGIVLYTLWYFGRFLGNFRGVVLTRGSYQLTLLCLIARTAASVELSSVSKQLRYFRHLLTKLGTENLAAFETIYHIVL